MRHLIDVVRKLRGPDGCPWDREQTPMSIRSFIIEEAHEVVEAIESGDPSHFAEELGDVLFHIILLSRMAEEENLFSLSKVAEGVSEKLVRRHPHVFGDAAVKNSADVEKSWEKIKAVEKGRRKSIGEGIPKTIPALTRAMRVSERAARKGFDWENIEGIFEKFREEVDELKNEIPGDRVKGNKKAGSTQRIEEELGDVLFVIVNLARHLGVDAEMALNGCTRRFCGRFDMMESLIKQAGKEIEKIGLREMEDTWQTAKKLIHN